MQRSVGGYISATRRAHTDFCPKVRAHPLKPSDAEPLLPSSILHSHALRGSPGASNLSKFKAPCKVK